MENIDPAEWHLYVELCSITRAADAAAALTEWGFAVFPLHSMDFEVMSCTCYDTDCVAPAKHPMTLHGHLDAVTDASEARALFRESAERVGSRYANVGVACGERSGGLVVVDVDPRNGGWDSLGELEYLAELQKVTLETLTSTTGGGGAHLWYRLPPGLTVPKKTGIRAGIDLQGEGAYVVAPPSLHPSSQQYVWGEERPLALLPPLFVEIASERREIETSAGGFRLPDGSSLSDVLAGKARVPAGSRDEAFTSLAARLRFNGATRADAEEVVLRVLREGTEQPAGLEYTEKQALAKVESAWRRLTAEPTEEGLREAAETFLESLQRETGMSVPLEVSLPGEGLLAGYSLSIDTDMANGHRLAVRWRDRLMYFPLLKRGSQWYKCNTEDAIWRMEPDIGDVAARSLEELIRLEALTAGDEETGARLAEVAHRCGSVAVMGAAARALALDDSVRQGSKTPNEVFDMNPRLVAFPNGVYDFVNDTFRAVSPGDLISKTVAYPYNPAAQCPGFLKFLERVIPDGEVRSCLLRFFGQALLGADKAQLMAIFYGSGANGKSSLLNIARKVMGAYAGVLPTSIFVTRTGRENPFDLVRLEGIRLGMNTMEVDVDQRLDDGALKAIISLDEIEGRGLYENFRKIRSQATLCMSANNMPKLQDTSYGMRRRLLAVNFNVTIPEAERDITLVDRLLTYEGSGVLALLVSECRAYLQHGIKIPDTITQFTDNYLIEENPLLRFEVECLEPSRTALVSFADLYKFYCQWCQYEDEAPLTKRQFSRQISRVKYPDKKSVINGKVVSCRYVTVKSPE